MGGAIGLSVLLTLVLAVGCDAAQAAPVVWVVPSLIRVGKAGPPGTARRMELAAARGECESFQIVVRGPAGGLTNVSVSASDLTRGQAVIPKAQLSLYREHYLEVKAATPFSEGGSNPSLGPGWYPDALIPFTDPATGEAPGPVTLRAVPFDLAADQNQPIWVDVLVPRGTAPGHYLGTLTVTSDQGRSEVALDLRVWSFDLPRVPALKTRFRWWHAADSVPELLRHRLMPDPVPAREERALIDGYGLNCANLWLHSGAWSSHQEMKPAPSVEVIQLAASEHQRDLLLYNFTADEINNPDLTGTVKEWARRLHQAGVANLITMAPSSELLDDGSGSGRSAVDIWVVLPSMFDEGIGGVREALAKGDQVWSYAALCQDDYSPKWEVDFDPIDYRIQGGFINQSLGITGLLYWQVDLWSEDPWHELSCYQHEAGPFPGEGLLVYPGEPVGIAGVVGSMRLKYLRDSVDDYDYVEILKRLGRADQALEICRRVGADWHHWTRDPVALEAARQELGDAIEAELAKAGG